MKYLNPTVSLFSAFVYSIIVSFSIFEIIYLLPVILLSIFNRRDIFFIIKKLFFLNLFIFTIFVFLLIQSDIYEALNIYIRTNIIIFFNLLLFHNSKGIDIVRGFYLMKFPAKFISTIYFTIKIIGNLIDDFKNIKATLKARNFKANSSLFTYQTFGNILAKLFINSIRKSENLNNSFKLRGFRGEIYLNDDFYLGKYDYLLVLSLSIIFLEKVFL